LGINDQLGIALEEFFPERLEDEAMLEAPQVGERSASAFPQRRFAPEGSMERCDDGGDAAKVTLRRDSCEALRVDDVGLNPRDLACAAP